MAQHCSTSDRSGERTQNGYRSDWTGYTYPSTAIVETVEAATGRPQSELDVLSAYVDGDALDDLLTNASSDIEITFEYDGVTVTVSSTGGIVVTEN